MSQDVEIHLNFYSQHHIQVEALKLAFARKKGIFRESEVNLRDLTIYHPVLTSLIEKSR